ncbi:MAG: DUF2953 domain-containing protein [Eubacteriales bacterium]|nr:DUF2953 domain-containing protein [Eubacteriales bacterium]
MLHIILTILKVIGIIAALILLLILLAGLSILFVPVRYRITGKKRDTDLESGVRVSWMFRIISAEILQEKKKVQFTIKIFGKTLEQWKKIGKKRKHRKAEPAQQIVPDSSGEEILYREKEQTSEQNRWEHQQRQKAEEESGKIQENEEEAEKKDRIERQEPIAEKKDHFLQEKNEEKKPRQREEASLSKEKTELEQTRERNSKWKRFFDMPGMLWKKIKALGNRMKKLWKNLKKRLRSMKKSLARVKETIDYYYTLFQEENTKQAIRFCKMQLIWIMKKLAPKKIKGDIRFGTGDPAITGELMGLVSVFLPVYSYNLELTPDFENTVFEGEIEMTGSVQGWHFLALAWRFFRNKDIKYVLKKLKR